MSFTPLPSQGSTSWYGWGGDVHNALTDPTSSAAAALKAAYGTVLTPSGAGDQAARINTALAATAPFGTVRRVTLVGDFTIGSSLLVPSQTVLDARQASVTLAAGAKTQMLCNSDYINGNTAITVIGGTWNYDQANQTGVGGNGAMAFDFRKVSQLHVRDATVLNAAKYAVRVAGCTYFSIEGITLNTASDGIHVNGPAAHGLIRDIKGTTGDDMVALTGRDYVDFEVSFGDITDIEIDGIYANGSLTALKLLGGGTTKLRRIRAANIHGTTTTHPVVVIDDGVVNGGVGTTDIGSTVIRNVTVAPTNTDAVVFITASQTRDLTISDVFAESISGQTAVILATLPINVQSLTIENVHLYGSGTGCLVQVSAGAQVGRCVIRGVYGLDSAASCQAVMINGGSSLIGTLTVSDAHLVLASSSFAFAIWGSCNEFYLSNSRIQGPQTVVSINGSSTSELKVCLDGVITSSITQDQVDISRPVVLTMDGCQFGQSGATALINVLGTSGSARITGTAVRNINNKTWLARGGTQALSVNNAGFGCDVSQLTPSDGDLAYNVNATLSCGAGLVVFHTGGTGNGWKNVYSGATY